MSNSLSNWFNGILNRGSNNGSYQTLDSNPINSSSGMPGGFPGEGEAVASGNRNRFNSRNVEYYIRQAYHWAQYLIIEPVIILLILMFRLLAKVLNIVFFDGSASSANNGNDPIDKVNKFVCDLEDQLTPEQQHNQHYGDNGVIGGVLPPFYQGSYTQALYMATSRAKFLYIYLTNPQNENSSIIFQKIITNPDFISIFSGNNDVMIWGGDLTNPEACQLANSLNITKFPFIGVMCLTRSTTMTPQGPVKTSPKISLILKIQGGILMNSTPASIIDTKFLKKMSKYEQELSTIRSELRNKFMSKALLRQQDLNYQQSLARDKAKKVAKMTAMKMEEYLQSRIPYFKKLLRENVKGNDKARIAIKMKNGERKTLYFPSDCPVQDIFEFTELCQENLLNEIELEDVDGDKVNTNGLDKFKGFVPAFKFKLVSPLPPKITLNEYLLNNAGVKIRDVECVYPNGLLIVEDS